MKTWSERLSPLLSWRVLVVLALWAASIAAAVLGGAYAFRQRSDIRAFLSAGTIIETNLYNLSVRELSVPADGRDGGIAALSDGILFANRFGKMWYVEPDLSMRELDLRIPINVDELEADPYNVHTIKRDRFAVKDLMVHPGWEGGRLVASYNHWYSEPNCYALRVVSLESPALAVLSDATEGPYEWKTVYETPCGQLGEYENSENRRPALGTHGRLATFSDDEILLTFGGYSPEERIGPPQPQTLDNPFGKTILINLRTGENRIYTRGHRNPQGLAVSSSGEVWLTEHGARGGDELNRIVDGLNYGFPLVTYGTQYGLMVWPSNPRQGRHEGYEKPMFAWVPSIGTSQVAVIEGDLFEHWRGDLMVSTLRERSLYRVRVEDGRVIFVEPIPIYHRMRDITQSADGTIVLKTDDNFLVFLRPIDDSALASEDLAPKERGQLLASGCSGCHSFKPDGGDGIGPNLSGVVGRRLASREGYAYSEALRDLGGRWTPDSLRRFLADPNGVAPGTTMVMTRVYDDSEVEALVAYLQELQ